MPKKCLVWLGMLCVFASMTYPVDARVMVGSKPQQLDGGYIAGTVRFHIPRMLRQVHIEAVTMDGRIAGSTDYFRSDGSHGNGYRIGPLAPGLYHIKTHVQVLHYFTFPSVESTSYYMNASTATKASVIEVTPGMTTTAELDLKQLGTISGNVLAQQTRRPVADSTRVSALNEAGEIVATSVVEGGQYVFRYLGAGTYTLTFSGLVEPNEQTCPEGGCANEQVYDALTLGPITVRGGESIENVNATLSLFDQPPSTYTYLPMVARSPQIGDRIMIAVTQIRRRTVDCTVYVDGEVTNSSQYTLRNVEVYYDGTVDSQGVVSKTTLSPQEQTTFSLSYTKPMENGHWCWGDNPYARYDAWGTITSPRV